MTPRAADSPVLRARFDGQRWVEGSLEGQDYAVPPLVDWACGIGGYREGVTSSMLRAPRAILKLLSEQGIATIRVLSSSWSELWRWQAVQGEQGWSVNTIGGGPTLVDSEPVSERERWIRNLDCLDRAMDHVVLEELGWVSVRTENRDFAQAVALRARQRGLHLAVRGPVALTGLLQEGDIFGGLLNLVRDSGSAPVAAVLAGWAGPESERASRVASDLVGRGVFLTTELLAAYRSVFVRESLDVPFLELNEPILPHVRWLLQMRRAGGYAAGRAALREYAGLAEPTKSEAAAARRGWSRLVSLAVDLLSSSTTLKLASSSPKLAMLPGFGLKEELVLLHASGVSLNRLLQQATGFPTGNEAQGRVLITQVPPESGERFLRSLRPAASGAS